MTKTKLLGYRLLWLVMLPPIWCVAKACGMSVDTFLGGGAGGIPDDIDHSIEEK
jgi:hypothetical protein